MLRRGCATTRIHTLAHILVGEPVSTPDQVRGRLSPGCALNVNRPGTCARRRLRADRPAPSRPRSRSGPPRPSGARPRAAAPPRRGDDEPVALVVLARLVEIGVEEFAGVIGNALDASAHRAAI